MEKRFWKIGKNRANYFFFSFTSFLVKKELNIFLFPFPYPDAGLILSLQKEESQKKVPHYLKNQGSYNTKSLHMKRRVKSL